MGHRTPKEDPLKTYLVLRPIGMGGRVDAGSQVQLRESEAKNYPPDFLKEIAEEIKADGDDAGSQTADANKGSSAGIVDDQIKTVDHVVTQEDLEQNPDLAATGVEVGQTIQIPEENKTTDHVVTQEDLEKSKTWRRAGYQVGQVIKIPVA